MPFLLEQCAWLRRDLRLQYFARTIPPVTQLSDAFQAFCIRRGWKKFAVAALVLRGSHATEFPVGKYSDFS